MNKIIPTIYSGNNTIVVSESFIADKRNPIRIVIPVKKSSSEQQENVTFSFVFFNDDVSDPKWEVTYEHLSFSYKLINFFSTSSTAGIQEPSRVRILGIQYDIYFWATGIQNIIQGTFCMHLVGDI